MYLLVAAILQGALLIAAAPAGPPPACVVSLVSPEPQGIICGSKGFLKDPNEISTVSAVDSKACARACANTEFCRSFAYTAGGKKCQLLGSSLVNQGYYNRDSQSGVVHYNVKCFQYSTTCLNNFYLRVDSTGTPVDGNYLGEMPAVPALSGSNWASLNPKKGGALPCTIDPTNSNLICGGTPVYIDVFPFLPSMYRIHIETPAVVATEPNAAEFAPLTCTFNGGSSLACSLGPADLEFYGDADGYKWVMIESLGPDKPPDVFKVGLSRVPFYERA